MSSRARQNQEKKELNCWFLLYTAYIWYIWIKHNQKNKQYWTNFWNNNKLIGSLFYFAKNAQVKQLYSETRIYDDHDYERMSARFLFPLFFF